jgi:hypothetical protein
LRIAAHGRYAALDYQERAMPRIRQSDAGPIIPGTKQKRPAPPPEFDEREAKTWTKITRSLPPDWFAGSQPLLTELCRHIRLSDDLIADAARARSVVDELRKTQAPTSKLLLDAAKQYRTLLRLHALQSQQIGVLSTRLRLTPQSRYDKSVAAVAAKAADEGPFPWDDYQNEETDPASDGQNGRNRKQ